MLSRGAVHDRQIRSAFVQFCFRHGSGSGSEICAATGLPHKSATCTGSTRRLDPEIMPTTRKTSIFHRNSRLNIVVPLFDYLSAPNAPFRRVIAMTSTLATVSDRLRRGRKVVSSRAELIHRNMRCAPDVSCWHEPDHHRCPLYFRSWGISGSGLNGRFWSRMVESRCGAVALGRTYLLPPLSSGGASMVRPWLRFHIPLIEPDRQISRIRLSDKNSRFRVQRLLQFLTIYRS
jgi:hypothetical protein